MSSQVSRTVVDRNTPDLGGNYRQGDLSCMSFSLWKMLVDRFSVGSLLDVGCGEGHAVSFFRRIGVIAHGIEGLRKNVDRAVTPISLHDLKTGPFYMPVDLVLSVEVAEHIDESFVENYLDTLNNGRVVVMTHALPGQAGYHHVNCQPQEYWVQKMEIRGYILDPMLEYWRKLSSADGHMSYFQKSGLVFIKID